MTTREGAARRRAVRLPLAAAVLSAAMLAPAMAQPAPPCDGFQYQGQYQGHALWTATRQANVLGTQGSYEVLPGQMASPDVAVRLNQLCR